MDLSEVNSNWIELTNERSNERTNGRKNVHKTATRIIGRECFASTLLFIQRSYSNWSGCLLMATYFHSIWYVDIRLLCASHIFFIRLSLANSFYLNPNELNGKRAHAKPFSMTALALHLLRNAYIRLGVCTVHSLSSIIMFVVSRSERASEQDREKARKMTESLYYIVISACSGRLCVCMCLCLWLSCSRVRTIWRAASDAVAVAAARSLRVYVISPSPFRWMLWVACSRFFYFRNHKITATNTTQSVEAHEL